MNDAPTVTMVEGDNEFSEWLKRQTFRDDPIGDLANDYVRAGKLPTLFEMTIEVEQALNEAVFEYAMQNESYELYETNIINEGD